ncbi:MAG: RraA family protein [Litorivicinus sp.]
MKPAWIERLLAVDTPTICNAIEMAQGARGFSQFTRTAPVWTGRTDQRMLGQARTARIASARPPKHSAEELKSRRQAYFDYMQIGEHPGIAVIQDLDNEHAIGAWWGEINALAHLAVCRLSGALTNGLVRDLGDLPAEFPIAAGAVGPSHGFVHVVDFGEPVEVFGLKIAPLDWVHADCHGAVVIPEAVLPDLVSALDRLLSAESVVLDPLRAGELSMDEFKRLWAEFERRRV